MYLKVLKSKQVYLKCRKGKRAAPQALMGGVEKEDAGKKENEELWFRR